MQTTNGQTTIDELRAQLGMLAAQVASLSADNEALAAENLRLADEARQWRADYDRLLEQIKQMNCRMFGTKSEKASPDQLSLFNDVEACADPSVPEPVLEEAIPAARPRRRGGRRALDLEALETVVIEHEIPESERLCPQCGGEMAEMKVEVTRTVRLVPARLVVEEHRRHVYICRPCSSRNAEDGSVPAVIVRAKAPKPPIPGSFASPSLISYVLNAKYSNATPLYRLEADFKTLDAEISRQNMANWVLGAHERWLSLIHARMREIIKGHDLLHADETPVQVLKEPDREAKKKSYMWLFRTARCDTPICVYEYTETRSGKNARSFLGGWSGTLVSDGYAPYFNLGPGVTNVACLAHVRRRFAAIVKAAGGDARVSAASDAVALEGRRRLDAIFALDREIDSLDPDAKREARQERMRPLMEDFERWAREKREGAVPRMALAKALDYAIKFWPYVMNALEDGRVELTNNIAERGIKAFVIGRKNFLFSDTPRGARASAAIYSIVTTAKLNGIKPRDYLEWLLEVMPNTEDVGEPEVLDRLMPWSDAVPQSCRMTPAQAAKAAEMPDDPIVDIDASVFDED